ncbi:MAG: serine/threonine protein kinase [Myxococcales bacterium]|nr:serine/threonine protein kinase [Myxococcales bacterium]
MIPKRIGKYEIDQRLGGGGMAEVFAARLCGAEGFARSVALKRVLPGYSQDSTFAAMFIREAQLSAKFNHPNVVSVIDFNRDPEHGLFLAMEMVEGRDLSDLMQTGLLPISVVVHVIAEVLRGLGYAHNLPANAPDGVRGVIHRDVSPHNVLLSWEGAVKVSDFGIAKARTVATSASASVMVKGKPAYMSPEQANGEPLDGRSDLFAVGVMLWEMLVGRQLFQGESMQALFCTLFFSPIPSPMSERPEVPGDLAAVTMRLLARERAQRYATAEDAVAALLACAAAPRDGRAELISTLQDRFPTLAPARISRAHPLAAGTPGPETQAAGDLASPALAVTLAAPAAAAAPAAPAASASASPSGSTKPRRLGLAFVAAGLLATAVTAGVARLVAGSSPAAPPPQPAALPAPSLAAPMPAAPAVAQEEPAAVRPAPSPAAPAVVQAAVRPAPSASGAQGPSEAARGTRDAETKKAVPTKARAAIKERAETRGATTKPVGLEQAPNALQ